MEDNTTYTARERADASTSAALVDFVGVFVLGGLLAWSLQRRAVHDRRARAAEQAVKDAGAPLKRGPAVIGGRVEAEEGPAITIEITQHGTELKTKHGWSHTWKEISRRVDARPFYVLRSGGERVRVEPDGQVLLVDKLDRTDRDEKTRRRRAATLVHGEQVYVTGELSPGFDPKQGGYRDGGQALVLKPPRSGRMLVSVEPLADRHRKRAKLHRNLAISAAVVLLVAHLVVFQFQMLRLFGQRHNADLRFSSTYRTWHKPKHSPGYWRDHYVVDATWGDYFLRDETSSTLHREFSEQRATAPFMIVPWWRALHQIGIRPTVWDWQLVVLFLLAGLYTPVHILIVVASRPWWDRRKITEGGSGRL